MNIVLSVTVHYDDTCTDETVTNTAKLTGKEMHNETNVVTADAPSRTASTARSATAAASTSAP